MDPADNQETNSPPNSIDVVVYMNDNTGVMLSVGHDTKADELFEKLLSEIKVGGETANLYRNTFSLWLVSDLLELQLKPSHIPFKLVCFWEELLDKYVQCSEEDKQRDEPMVMFQRNVYMSKEQELEIQDTQALSFLYHEARTRVVQGRYPLELDVAEECAVLQAMVMAATGDEVVGSAAFFLENLKHMMAAKYCKRNLLWRKSQNPEHRLAALYQAKSQGSLASPSLSDLYLSYLKHCHKLPSYGGAFLRAQIECPVKRFDEPVLVCISLNNLSVFSHLDQCLVVSIPFERLSWQYAESSNRQDSNTLPCLFVMFPQLDEGGVEVNKLLQVFSKSAILADNLLETLISIKKSQANTASPQDLQIFVDSKRVALAVFDESGKKLRSSIRAPKDKHNPAHNV